MTFTATASPVVLAKSATPNTTVAVLDSLDMSKLGLLGLSSTQIEAVKATFSGLQTANKSVKKSRQPREPPAEDARCMARVWGSKEHNGHGPQCGNKRKGGEFCQTHAKQAAVSEDPCQYISGKKHGLFCGRFDKPLTGKDADGKWQLLWLTPEMKALVAEEEADGTFQLGDQEKAQLSKKKSPSGGKKAKASAKKSAEKKTGAPKAERATTAYFFYLASVREQIKTDILAAATATGADEFATAKLSKNGSVKVAEVTKTAGAMWRGLSEEQKTPYNAMNAADKAAKIAAFEAESESTATTGAGQATPTIDAAALIASLTADDDEEVSTESLLIAAIDLDESGPWTYTLPEESALVDNGDDDDFDPTAAVVVEADGNHCVVSMTWYENAEPDDLNDSSVVVAASIGTLTTPVFAPEGEEIQGTFLAKA